jgi:serine/threonine protein kinase/TolA-binding protein
MLGRTIAHYRVVEKLGSGGMGVVYRAEDLKLGRPVALKFLSPDLLLDSQASARFEREARTASALNHPNICTIYAIDDAEGQRFIAMELLDGQPLSDVIGSRPTGVGTIIDIGVQIADALDAAHSQGILHRDIKPANIFVTRRGQAKVLDFGLAKLALGDSGMTGSIDTDLTVAAAMLSTRGMALGTVAYMSPEQARGETLDARSDLFSFGVVLYEMATGQQAFTGRTSAIVFDGILNRMPAPIGLLAANIPAELERIIGKALEKDRDLRYQTASDLRADLQRLRRDRESGRVATVSGATAIAGGPSSMYTPAVESGAARIASASSVPPALSASGTPPTVLDPAAAGVPAPVTAIAAGAVQPAAAVKRPARRPDKDRTGGARTGITAVVVLVLAAAAAGTFWWTARSAAGSGQDQAAVTLPPVPDAPATAAMPAEAIGDGLLHDANDAAPAPETADTGAASAPASRPRTERTARSSGVAAAPAAAVAPIAPVVDSPLGPLVPKATLVDPGPARLAAARAKVDARQFDQAIADIYSLLREHPASAAAPGAYLLLGRTYERQSRADDAMAAYTELRSRFGDSDASAEGTLQLAQLLMRTRRRDRVPTARDMLAKLAAQQPQSPFAPRALAAKAGIEHRENLKERDAVLGATVPSALVTNRLLVERYPTSREAEGSLWLLGEAYDDLRRYDLAAQAFSRLGETFPQTRYDAWWRAGEIYEKRLKDKTAARSAYAKVPERSRNYRDAQRKLKE